MADSKLAGPIKLYKQQLAIMFPGSVCVQYAKPWPHSGIRSCCHQSTNVFTSSYDSTLLGHKDNIELARVLLASIVCKSIEQHAIVGVNSSISVLYAQRLSNVLHAH